MFVYIKIIINIGVNILFDSATIFYTNNGPKSIPQIIN